MCVSFVFYLVLSPAVALTFFSVLVHSMLLPYSEYTKSSIPDQSSTLEAGERTKEKIATLWAHATTIAVGEERL